VPTAAAGTSNSLSSYQTEFNTLNSQDTQELLYASFLSPAESLANGNAVLEQAAQLLGTPGAASSLSTGTNPSTSGTPSSSASTTSSSLNNLPSVASILAASDAEAAQTLQNYASAPPDSSIIDYQA
jgi:hypothetical protein